MQKLNPPLSTGFTHKGINFLPNIREEGYNLTTNKVPLIKGDVRRTGGFTLVELIVVITILAILWTIAFITLQWYSADARDSTRISDISSMKTSLELYNLDAWKFPAPTDYVNITYSGWTVWSQWTYWETVYANTSKLDKIPLDPVTNKEYTYSTTSNKYEYQIWGIMEGDIISMNNEKWIMNNVASSPLTRGELRGVSAWTTEAIAYVTWNYNWNMSKTLSWTNCNVLAVPTIITNDTSVTDLQQIIANNSFVYRWYNNLPSSFATTKFNSNWWFDFAPNNLVAYDDTWACEVLVENTNSWTIARVELLDWLQQAYSWTVIANEWEIKNILALDIDVNNPSSAVINYAGNFVNNTMWANIIVDNTSISWTSTSTWSVASSSSCKDLYDNWTTTSWDYSVNIPWIWQTTIYCDMTWWGNTWPYDTSSTLWITKLLIQSNETSNWSTTFTDSSTGNHTLWITGSPSHSLLMSKMFNSSINFPNNGAVNTVNVTSSPTDFNFWIGEFTIDFWVSYDNLSDKHWLFWKNDQNWIWLMFNHDNDHKLNFFAYNPGSWWTWIKWAKTDWVKDTMYHIAVVWSNNTYYVFVNGKLDIIHTATNNMTEPAVNLHFWNSPANIVSHQLHGFMDEIRVVKWVKKWDWVWHIVWDQVFTPPTLPYKYSTIPAPFVNNAKSCKNILDSGNSTWDGMYTVDRDGPWGMPSVNTYCDMTNGWRTLVVRAANNWDNWLNTTSNFWTTISPSWTTSAKAQHAYIQYLVDNSTLENPVKMEFPEASVNRYVWKNCSWTSSANRNKCASWAVNDTTTTHTTKCWWWDWPNLNNWNWWEWASNSISWPYQDGTCVANGWFSTSAWCTAGLWDSWCNKASWSSITWLPSTQNYKVNFRVK